jgi:arylsulfatase A-like enzyme
MGYQTPNIDRLAKEGMMFTDYYAENSCTAGRAAFITGQTVLRTGLSRVGMPGAEVGLQHADATLAELLKNHDYMTGQFGKNHLGDRNEFLPTVHGFDEFYGNLYHLNAEEDPEHPDYPSDPEFKARFGPRGVLDVKASTRDYRTAKMGARWQTSYQRYRPINEKTHGNSGPGVCRQVRGLHEASQQSGQTVLRLVQLVPHAYVHPPAQRVERQVRPEFLRRRDASA